MSKIDLSVIVPVYNAEKTIQRCLDSILCINSIDIEIFLINDGSIDNSRMICTRFAERDKRVKILNEPNKGSSTARNLGIAYANGKYVTFVDSDDYVDSDDVVNFYHYANNGNFDICYCDYFGGQGATIYTRRSQDFGTSKIGCVKAMMLLEMQGYCWNKIYKRTFLKGSKQTFVDGANMWEDLSFNLRLFSVATRIGYAKDICYYHYDFDGNPTSITHSSSTSSTMKEWKCFENMVRNVDSALQFIDEEGKTMLYLYEILWLKSWLRTWLLKNKREYLKEFVRLYPETNDVFKQKWKNLNPVYRFSSNLLLKSWISQYILVTSIGNNIYNIFSKFLTEFGKK